MLFNSLPFLFLVLATFVVYYVPKFNKQQVSILIIASLFFYAYSSPSLLLLLLSSAAINVVTSYYVVYGKAKRRKVIATIGVIANLLILAFFKYAFLFSSTLFSLGDSVSEFLITIPLPVGISFYTFQGVSLLVDVYQNENFDNKENIPESLRKHAQRTLFFIAFFPQLVAGPIVKAYEFYPQIVRKYFSKIKWESAFRSIVLGYFLKMVVADNLKDYTFWMEYPYFEPRSNIILALMLIGFSFQIFADFAGYSLIAIGISKLFGYNIPENFNFPYISKSLKEFWGRWHISLSSFLKEYLYFPLGGNRKGKVRTLINLIITMFLGGLWHGAAWSYAIWGLFHGGLLALERVFTNRIKIKDNWFTSTVKIVVVFTLVTLSWLLFKLPEFSHAVLYMKALVSNTHFPDEQGLLLCLRICLYSAPVVLYYFFYVVRNTRLFQWVKKYDYIVYGLMLFLLATNSGTSEAFIYFQF